MKPAHGSNYDVPPWFDRLARGNIVFGARKDKMLLEIIDLGGMDLIPGQCGVSFTAGEEAPSTFPKLKALVSLRDKLLAERIAAEHILGLKRRKKAAIKAIISLAPGVISAKFFAHSQSPAKKVGRARRRKRPF